MIITKTNAHISTEGNDGIFPQVPTINNPIENDVSAMQTLSQVETTQYVLYENQLSNINMIKYCLTTAYAQYSGDRGSCWGCLATKYKGMEFNLDSNLCSDNCGDINPSKDCMADAIHVTSLTPTNNVVKWMERNEKALLDNHESTESSRYFLIRHSSNHNYLQSPKFNINGKKHDTKFSCDNLEIMPDIMCDYESDRLKNKFDLDNNQVHVRDNDMSESSPKRVANVVVVKWITEDSESVEENAAYKDCFLCLTRKHKVVLISWTKRYAWMVDFGSCPYCERCNGKVTLARSFHIISTFGRYQFKMQLK
uniref:AlNc14C157G7681 protein n=1 Tax=Albugo laibachii Nc14 TaxID=890382 RepID=F0WMJ1_9STRA|nr:AlNc14C157G7681 [Albugo laibachii Nc14]|eukprot:CCA22523.1 AlNc14C157G7681 [Albugo laibachii Nc14]